MAMSARVDRARSISAVIDGLADAEVRTLVDTSEINAIGIGGTTRTVHIDGMPVFVKQLPITESEQASPLSTRNHTGLPFVSHYGITSPSPGVGRELAAHELTSEWVRSGETDVFPLLLGWRIIALRCETDLREFDADEPKRRWGAYWPQLEKRLTELRSAPTSLVLFLENVPETLGSCVRRGLAEGSGEAVFAAAAGQIVEATAWMKEQGFHHFDVHPGNILVREGRLLFTDFGLSLHREFELTPDEEASLATHGDFDRDTGLMHLFHWALFELGCTSGPERLELLRIAAADPTASALDPVRTSLGSQGADLIAEHASVIIRMTEMFAVLVQDVFGTRYDG